MKTTTLIMAGGRGERFWPKSRKSTPKQFLTLADPQKTMIQSTVERILPLVKPEDILIATNRDYRDLVCAQLPAEKEDEENDSHYYDESPSYSRYGGYNGYDDDTIDSAFEGDPDATWNID